ncbi:uncharacterized protein LOC115695925 isoform X1 [Cannabis sativa]|uniref:uncharacterized protein LOC115695925 isoform X1 n=1 Tax=Cannabis sativa TaxID=3483 RepID=UPI0029CA17E8|nr:uncharacterized protein LOC115695925 isoform X1 [Cannabis sativa]
MAPPPGPYSGTSTLALVARASAFSIGLVYGSLKLKYLQVLHYMLFSIPSMSHFTHPILAELNYESRSHSIE